MNTPYIRTAVDFLIIAIVYFGVGSVTGASPTQAGFAIALGGYALLMAHKDREL